MPWSWWPPRWQSKAPDLQQPGSSGKTGRCEEDLWTMEELCTRLGVVVDGNVGLTTEEAERRLVEQGPNELTPPKPTPVVVRFLSKLLDPLLILVDIGALLCLVLYLTDRSNYLQAWVALVLWGVVLFSACLAFYQDGQTEEAMGSFKRIMSDHARVRRDGVDRSVPTKSLVTGDLVRLSLGERVPADCRVISAHDLKVDMCSFTGEAEPVELSPGCSTIDAEEATSRHTALNSSLIMEGEGWGLVVRTGDRTLIGRIAATIHNAPASQSTFEAEVLCFVKVISFLAVTVSLALFIVAVARGGKPMAMFVEVFVVSIVVNIPQGLPATVTSCLTVCAQRLARQNIFVKRLDCVEGLGATTVLATDKTGTITINRMTVSHLWTAGEHMHTAADYRKVPLPCTASMSALLRAAALCNMAKLETTAESSGDGAAAASVVGEGGRQLTGNASDKALYEYCDCVMIPGGLDKRHTTELKPVEALRTRYAAQLTIPFSSSVKWMKSVHTLAPEDDLTPSSLKATLPPPPPGPSTPPSEPPPGSLLVVMKGAPEVVVASCSAYLKDDGLGEVCVIDEGFMGQFNEAYRSLASLGERVLGLAHKTIPRHQSGSLEGIKAAESRQGAGGGYSFLGLISLSDPPKEGVAESVSRCKAAGVRVVMITGDHPLTAEAIARQVNIIRDYKTCPASLPAAATVTASGAHGEDAAFGAAVVSCRQTDTLDETGWSALLSKPELVFARASPQDKLNIVQRLKAMGEIVAVTGDGVNDSPALKFAHTGVAMGARGSEVAKAAADVIIMDDDLTSIVHGIEEGRLLVDNLKKTIAYTLTHLPAELSSVAIRVLFGLPYGMSTLQVLTIETITEFFPAGSFAWEPAESNVMDRPPRKRGDRLVGWSLMGYAYLQAGVITAASCVLAYLLTFTRVHNVPLQMLRGFGDRDTGPLTLPDGRVLDHGQQTQIVQSAMTAWFSTLILSQACHVFLCKTRYMAVLAHGLCNNRFMFAGVGLALAIMIMVIYLPGLSFVCESYPRQPFVLYLPFLISGVALLVYNEGRKYCIRKAKPDSLVVKWLAW